MRIYSLNQKIDRIITENGSSFHYFSGTSYLGIGLQEQFKHNVILGIEKYGINHGQSRINNVRLDIFEQFEEFFANAAEAEKAIVFSSGYLAGVAALQFLGSTADQIWVAPDTHPAILPTHLKPDPEQDFAEWRKECLAKAEHLSPQRILILGNAIDPLTPEIHDYSWLVQVAQKHEVSLLIDDSHAFGVIGKGIFGTYASLKSLPLRLLVSGSLGKGIGISGGILLTDAQTHMEIKKLPIYGGASPCSPAFLYAFLETQDIYAAQLKRLKQLTKYFASKNLIPEHIIGNENYPVFRYSDTSWVDELESNNIITSSFPYPTANDERVNRIIISAFHRAEDIDMLSDTIIQINAK